MLHPGTVTTAAMTTGAASGTRTPRAETTGPPGAAVPPRRDRAAAVA